MPVVVRNFKLNRLSKPKKFSTKEGTKQTKIILPKFLLATQKPIQVQSFLSFKNAELYALKKVRFFNRKVLPKFLVRC